MSQTVSRLFDNPASAQAAAAELKSHLFTTVQVFGEGAASGPLAAQLEAAQVPGSHAKVFIEKIRGGATLVTVRAQFGTAYAAMDILDSHGPIDSGIPSPDRTVVPDDPAPLSGLLGMPTLVAHDDSFSRFWSLPILLRSGAPTFGSAEVSPSYGPFKGTFGMAMISNNPAPLSSMLGLPTVIGARRG